MTINTKSNLAAGEGTATTAMPETDYHRVSEASASVASTSGNDDNNIGQNKNKIRVISIGLLDDHSLDMNKLSEVQDAIVGGMSTEEYIRFSNDIQQAIGKELTPQKIQEHQHRLFISTTTLPTFTSMIMFSFIIITYMLHQQMYNPTTTPFIFICIWVLLGRCLEGMSRRNRSLLHIYRTKREQLCTPVLAHYTRQYIVSHPKQQPVFIYKHDRSKIQLPQEQQQAGGLEGTSPSTIKHKELLLRRSSIRMQPLKFY